MPDEIKKGDRVQGWDKRYIHTIVRVSPRPNGRVRIANSRWGQCESYSKSAFKKNFTKVEEDNNG